MTEIYLILELTTRCNLDCGYCYNIWKEKGDYPEGDLDLELLPRILDQITATTRIGGITLAGGEPLLYRRLVEVGELLSRRKIPLSITTNGLMLEEELLLALQEVGLRHVEISMPAVAAETYNAICGSHALKRVRTAIVKVKKLGLTCSVSSVVTRLNVHELGDIIEMAAALSADTFLFNRFIPGGKGFHDQERLALSSEALMDALTLADRAGAAFRLPVTVPIPIEHCLFDTSDLKHLHFGTCTCGLDKWVVDPFGNLRICEQHPEILGSLLEKSFVELAHKKETEDFRARNVGSDCLNLPCYKHCGGGCRFA